MLRAVTARPERWPLIAPFRISRGVKTAAEVVRVEIVEGVHRGRGEGVPYARYGETIASVLSQLAEATRRIERGLTRAELPSVLPPGAARNAVDCALWDLEARKAGRSVAELLGQPPLGPVVSALTVSLDSPEVMGRAAAGMAGAGMDHQTGRFFHHEQEGILMKDVEGNRLRLQCHPLRGRHLRNQLLSRPDQLCRPARQPAVQSDAPLQDQTLDLGTGQVRNQAGQGSVQPVRSRTRRNRMNKNRFHNLHPLRTNRFSNIRPLTSANASAIP